MKGIKISYQSLKEFWTFITFVMVSWFVLDYNIKRNAFESMYVEMGSESISMWLSFLIYSGIIVSLVFLIWLVSVGIVSALYLIIKTEPAYKELNQFNLSIPITKGMYQKLKKVNSFKMKRTKLGEEYTPYRLNEWAKKLTYKELNKIIKKEKLK